MKIFNNWHQALIFLLMTEVTHEQGRGALCAAGTSPALPGPDPFHFPMEIAQV